jgi:hypothetical protein
MSKITRAIKAGGVGPAVEHLPGKCKEFKPQYYKKKKKINHILPCGGHPIKGRESVTQTQAVPQIVLSYCSMCFCVLSFISD